MKNLRIFIVLFSLALFSQNATAQIENCDSIVDLITNGDFSAGNTGFTTGTLTQRCSTCTANSYCIGDDTHDKCTSKAFFTGTGNFMTIDGYSSGSTYREFWGQTVNVQANTEHTISFRVRDQYSNSSANFSVRVMVNNVQVALTPNFGTSWTTYTYTWNSGATSGNIPFSLQINGNSFRDFAIDDIFFGYCYDCEVSADIDVEEFGNCFFNFSANITSNNRNIIGYFWDFGDGNTSTLASPSHQYTASGVYEVCVTVIAQDRDGCCSFVFCTEVETDLECILEGKRNNSSDLGNTKALNKAKMSLYPNPNEGELKVRINVEQEQSSTARLSVYDISGKIVLERMVDLTTGTNEINVNTVSLEAGVYQLKLDLGNGGKSFTEKFVRK
jgi:hypothetical protein